MSTPLGTLFAYQLRFPNLATAVLLCDFAGTPTRLLSTHLDETAVRRLAPDEFFVDTQRENQDLVQPALDSGLFEDTRQTVRPRLSKSVLAVWKIVRASTPPKRQVLEQPVRDVIAHVATVLRKFASAASTQLTMDCYVHALLGRALLADAHVEARLVVGFAAWRVGPGPSDVIAHAPNAQSILPAGARGFEYHTWLECSGFIVDFTTYQLRWKAKRLDAADGGKTTVDWCPDFLVMPAERTLPYVEVRDSWTPGAPYYEERPELQRVLDGIASLDPQDLKIARFIASSSRNMRVLGPNHLKDDSTLD